MDLFNNLVLSEDDNIDLLLSLLAFDEQPRINAHHEIDHEI